MADTTQRLPPDHVSVVPPLAAAGLLLLAAVASFPYGFYQVLRLVVCGAAAYLAYLQRGQASGGWMWVFVAVALVFNPITPVHLSRATWRPINALTAAAFLVFLLQNRRRLR